MALSFMQAGQHDDRQLLEDQDAYGHGADLDSTVAVQLIAKTARLSISCLGSEAIEFPVPDDRPRAQTCDATTGEWLEAASAENSAPACGVLTSACNFSTMEIPSTPRPSGEELDAARMDLFPSQRGSPTQLLDLPNEVLFQILGYLEVFDLLATSRVRPLFSVIALAHSESHPSPLQLFAVLESLQALHNLLLPFQSTTTNPATTHLHDHRPIPIPHVHPQANPHPLSPHHPFEAQKSDQLTTPNPPSQNRPPTASEPSP
jgi:hypothetical protein